MVFDEGCPCFVSVIISEEAFVSLVEFCGFFLNSVEVGGGVGQGIT